MGRVDQALASLADATREQNALLAQIARQLEPPPPPERGPGQREPQLLGEFLLPAMFRSIPGLAGEFQTVVPARFWDRIEDGAVVKCPCRAIVWVVHESTAICTCQRVYLLADRLRVAGSPKSPTRVVD